jgi:uncharacterized Zn-binding protein involved in type VI secretion
MGNISHRNGDARACGASTVVVGQDFVFIDDQLWAVLDDPDSHGDGGLINSQDFVFINDKPIILVGDSANPDDLCPIDMGPHCQPSAVSGSPTVFVND